MLPIYRGFLVLEYGPEVQSDFAPTLVVLVRPPACRTALNLITSPKKIKKDPYTQKILWGSE